MFMRNTKELFLMKISSSLLETERSLTKCQNQALMTIFQDNLYPEKEEICRCAISLGVSKRGIQDWLSNMRRRKRVGGLLLESEYCSVL